MYGSVVVAEIEEFTLGGFQQSTSKSGTTFGQTIAHYEAIDAQEPGKITFKGFHDPSDSTGQEAVAAAAKLKAHFDNLYFYENTNTFWRVGAGGYIIVETCDAISAPRTSYATVNFSAQASDALMERVGTGT
ncbi:MAG: hypothetical protein WC750_06335 [Patescibacteria group bacterium]|jgi:hypothetical protein